MTVPIQQAEVHTESNMGAVSTTDAGSDGKGTRLEPRPPRSRKVRTQAKADRRKKRSLAANDDYLASAAIKELPQKGKSSKPRFASPYKSSYLDYMDGSNRRGNYGGMARLEYFMGGMIAGTVGSVFTALAFHIESVIMLAMFVLAGMCAKLWLASERCVNLGLDGYWCFALLIPILGLLFAIVLAIGPEGYAEHRKLDRTAYAIVVAYLFGGAALTFFAIAFAVMQGLLR